MNDLTKRFLQMKNYNSAILNYDRLIKSLNHKEITNIRRECKEVLDYMLSNAPNDDNTIVAANNLFCLNHDFGNSEAAEPYKTFLLQHINPKFVPKIYDNDERWFPLFFHDAVSQTYESLPTTFKQMIDNLKTADSLEAVGNAFSNLECIIFSGNFLLTGFISESLRNFQIDRWHKNHRFDIAVPILEAEQYFNCALIKFRKGPSRYQFFPLKFYPKSYRASFLLSVIYAIFMRGERERARRYYSLLRRAVKGVSNYFMDTIIDYADSIFYPLTYPFIHYMGSIIENQHPVLQDCFLLSLAQEFVLNENGAAALDTLSFLQFNEPQFNNAMFYALREEYWAIKSDAYELLDMPDEQSAALREWAKYQARSKRFQENAGNHIRKFISSIFENWS